MEAKGRIISQKEIDAIDEGGVVEGDIVPYLKRQDEISFKAGQDQQITSLLAYMQSGELDKRFNELKQVGKKEVAEFIVTNALRANYIADPSKECWGISDSELAKLKEWINGKN